MTLSERDRILSARLGSMWPHDPLLTALGLPSTAAVLDVGAGDGAFVRRLRTLGHLGSAVALDTMARPDVHAGDAHNLPFPARTFDVVLFTRVLAHLDSPEQALQEAARVLRPGGRLVVTANGPCHLERLRRMLGEHLVGAECNDLLTPMGAVLHTTHLQWPVNLTRPDAPVLLRLPALDTSRLPDTWQDTVALSMRVLTLP